LHIPVKKATCSGNKKPLPELSVSPLLSYRGGFFHRNMHKRIARISQMHSKANGLILIPID
jgi:hypothetical protein